MPISIPYHLGILLGILLFHNYCNDTTMTNLLAAVAALALLSRAVCGWNLPPDAYTLYPEDSMPRDDMGNVRADVWEHYAPEHWTPLTSTSECFDFEKCADCWLEECVQEADKYYHHCLNWSKDETQDFEHEGGTCASLLDADKAGDTAMCKAYGECVYKDCGYDCDNCRGPKCPSAQESLPDSSSSSDSSSSDSISDDAYPGNDERKVCKKRKKICNKDCDYDLYESFLSVGKTTQDYEYLEEQDLLFDECIIKCKNNFKECLGNIQSTSTKAKTVTVLDKE